MCEYPIKPPFLLKSDFGVGEDDKNLTRQRRGCLLILQKAGINYFRDPLKVGFVGDDFEIDAVGLCALIGRFACTGP